MIPGVGETIESINEQGNRVTVENIGPCECCGGTEHPCCSPGTLFPLTLFATLTAKTGAAVGLPDTIPLTWDPTTQQWESGQYFLTGVCWFWMQFFCIEDDTWGVDSEDENDGLSPLRIGGSSPTDADFCNDRHWQGSVTLTGCDSGSATITVTE